MNVAQLVWVFVGAAGLGYLYARLYRMHSRVVGNLSEVTLRTHAIMTAVHAVCKSRGLWGDLPELSAGQSIYLDVVPLRRSRITEQECGITVRGVDDDGKPIQIDLTELSRVDVWRWLRSQPRQVVEEICVTMILGAEESEIEGAADASHTN